MKSRPLRIRVITAIIIAVLIQITVIFSLILASGTFARLDESTISVFKNSTNERAKRLGEYMERWSDIEESYVRLSGIIDSMAGAEGSGISTFIGSPENRRRVLEACLPEMISCQGFAETSSVFLILENGLEDKDAICIRDASPKEHSDNKRNLLGLAGDREVLKQQNIALDFEWNTDLTVYKTDEFYSEPFKAGNTYTSTPGKHLGVYTGMNVSAENGRSFIAYSMPLLDEFHQSIGVFGVGISKEYLIRILPEEKSNIDPKGSFFMGIDLGHNEIKNVFAHGGIHGGNISSRDVVGISQANEGLYRPDFGEGEDLDLCLDFYETFTYDKGSPYVDRSWVAGFFVDEDSLHSASTRFAVILWTALVFALIIGVISAMLVSRFAVKPLGELMSSLKKMTPADPEILPSGTQEVDLISQEITSKNREIMESATKMATILELSSSPVGVLDYRNHEEFAVVTPKAAEIIGVKMPESWQNYFIPRGDYIKYIQPAIDSLIPEEEEEGIYSYSDSGFTKYIQIRQDKEENSTVTVLIDVTDSMMDKLQIRYERDFDLLTDIYNRRAFERVIVNLFDDGYLDSAVMSVWDLDNLKYVNDNFGHEMGDDYIKSLSEVFRSTFPVDNSVLGRRSGDEFFVFIFNLNDREMEDLLRKAHDAFMVQSLKLPGGITIKMSVSAGYALYRQGMKYEQLERYADFAMYDAKRASKGVLHAFDYRAYDRDQILMRGVGELNRILEEEDIRYHFQPIFNVKTKEVFGYEALMEPVSDLVLNATELIRLAESQSKLSWIERMTWTHGIREFYEQYGDEEAGKKVLFIKTLPNQCLSAVEFKQLEKEFGDKLKGISIETVENARMDPAMEDRKRRFCRRWNISMTLDDYGSGYSNSDVLTARDYDFVKISIGLIRDIDKNENKKTLVSGMVDYCHKNGQTIIAEGVETESEMETLLALGVDLVQGYYLGKPERKE